MIDKTFIKQLEHLIRHDLSGRHEHVAFHLLTKAMSECPELSKQDKILLKELLSQELADKHSTIKKLSPSEKDNSDMKARWSRQTMAGLADELKGLDPFRFKASAKNARLMLRQELTMLGTGFIQSWLIRRELNKLISEHRPKLNDSRVSEIVCDAMRSPIDGSHERLALLVGRARRTLKMELRACESGWLERMRVMRVFRGCARKHLKSHTSIKEQ